MLHKYECEKCGSVCYTESEVWESCPICEETPEERKIKERAERAEQARDRYAQLLHLAGKILGDVPDAQVKDNQGKVWDGDYLAAHIQDVLEDKA